VAVAVAVAVGLAVNLCNRRNQVKSVIQTWD